MAVPQAWLRRTPVKGRLVRLKGLCPSYLRLLFGSLKLVRFNAWRCEALGWSAVAFESLEGSSSEDDSPNRLIASSLSRLAAPAALFRKWAASLRTVLRTGSIPFRWRQGHLHGRDSCALSLANRTPFQGKDMPPQSSSCSSSAMHQQNLKASESP